MQGKQRLRSRGLCLLHMLCGRKEDNFGIPTIDPVWWPHSVQALYVNTVCFLCDFDRGLICVKQTLDC